MISRHPPARSWLIGGSVVVAAVLTVSPLLRSSSPAPADAPGTSTVDAGSRTVTVISVSPAEYRAEVSAFAEVRPRWVSTIRAAVGGRLVHLSSRLEPGSRVQEGEVLAVVDSTARVADVAEATNRIAAAELALVRAEQEAQEARLSWEESGLVGDPLSSLVLRRPYVAAAEAELAAARAARTLAEDRKADATIRAPFDGVVTERFVSRGETLSEGELVASLFAAGPFDLTIPLSADDWEKLPEQLPGTVASVREPTSGREARARVLRSGGSVDPSTRMRALHLVVADPHAADGALLPGSFVEVRIPGRRIAGLLRLPEGVLTREGRIWYVDENDLLQSFAAVPSFTSPGVIYVPAPAAAPASWRIVRYPLGSYLAGQSVVPKSDETGG